ncbi:hypothetical protein SAMN05421510_10468 [Nitrosomonas ureae]|uniref:Uncharacterized protein n=1 Tax=Nitrosomonas ureae TaxID=44577 RepID=A0A1H9FMZ6_9PROT|nr:hypothetical protein C8R28_100454 [Nitrosomonas ureae]SEQ39317.1 hypothetical protein SAMN05421510_10468 [Nitrosomonas ureae]
MIIILENKSMPCIDIPASEAALLLGKVDVNESYFGAKRHRGFHGKFKRGHGTLKQPVFGVFERDVRVYTEIVPDYK